MEGLAKKERKRRGFSKRMKVLAAALLTGLAIYTCGKEIARMPLSEMGKASICVVSESGKRCYVDREDTDEVERELDDLPYFVNKGNDRVMDLLEDAYFIIYPTTKGGIISVLGGWDDITGNIRLYRGADLTIILHEFLHKVYGEGLDRDTKERLKEELLALYEFSTLPEEEQREVLGEEYDKLASFLDGLSSIGAPLELLAEMYPEEYEEVLSSEIFADMPFRKGMGIPKEYVGIYSEILSQRAMRQLLTPVSIKPILKHIKERR